MLPTERRVRRREEFAEVIRRGSRTGAAGLVLHVLVAGEAPSVDPATPGPARAGFVVGRGVGPAVVRNRLRRRLRHLMAARLPQLGAGSLVVVRATPAARDLDHAGLARTLDRLLARALPARPIAASTS